MEPIPLEKLTDCVLDEKTACIGRRAGKREKRAAAMKRVPFPLLPGLFQNRGERPITS